MDAKQNYLNINLKGGRIIKVGGITASLAPLAVAVALLASPAAVFAADGDVKINAYGPGGGAIDTSVIRVNNTGTTATITNLVVSGNTTTGATTTGTLSAGNTTTADLKVKGDLKVVGDTTLANTTTGTLSAGNTTTADLKVKGDLKVVGDTTLANTTTGTLSAGNTTVGTLNAGNTTVGTLNAGNTTVGTLNAGNTTVGTLNAGNTTVANLQANNIVASGLTVGGASITNLQATNTTLANVTMANMTVSNSLVVKPGATVDLGGNRLQNVVAGVQETDGANMSQLRAVEKMAKQQGAIAAAAVSIPLPPGGVIGETTVGAGLGASGGYAALAVGVSSRIKEDLIIKGTLGMSGSTKTIGVGIGYTFK